MYKLNCETSLTEFVVTDSVLSDMEIEKIKEIHENETSFAQKATVGNYDYDPNVRESTVSWFDGDFLKRNNCYDIWQKISNQLDVINEEAFKFDLQYIEPFQITKYSSSHNGFYKPHIDADSMQKNTTRKLSFVIQLSSLEDFEGGEFLYYKNAVEKNVTKECPEKMAKGNIIVFPSFIPHGVTPVTKGTRYSLVGWCCGPRFR